MKKNNKGFTLAEMLIVVAIISVLIAILVPTFSTQLKKARAAADAGNIRTKYAEWCAEFLEDGSAEAKEVTLKGNHEWNGIDEISGWKPGSGEVEKNATVKVSGSGDVCYVEFTTTTTKSGSGDKQQ